jgi:hypothetical protein
MRTIEGIGCALVMAGHMSRVSQPEPGIFILGAIEVVDILMVAARQHIVIEVYLGRSA